ncbi:MAG: hypothetical protein AB1Z98_07135 [Nannocystaceae bacterium]
MSVFPGQPRTLRGAIVSVNLLSLLPVDVILFEINPHTLTRSFEVKPGISGAEAGQVGASPAESIKVEVEIVGTDEQGSLGVASRVAALENLVTPSAAQTIANLVLLNVGTIEITPPSTRLTLFVWGPQRVVPVVITELSVTEERHDVDLTPLVARVSLGMRVLNWDDVGQFHPAFGLSLSHQLRKEALVMLSRVRSLQRVLGTSALPT